MPRLLRKLMHEPASRVTLLAVILSLLTVEGYLIFVWNAGVPSVRWGLQPFVVIPGGDDPYVTQTMLMKAGGFHRLQIWPESTQPEVDGDVVFVVRDITGRNSGPIVLRERISTGGWKFSSRAGPCPIIVRERVSAESVFQSESYTLEFPPILESSGRRYRLEIWLTETSPRGLGFRAVRGRRYRDGGLANGNRALWANLMFRASATRAPMFVSLAHHFEIRERFPGRTFLILIWVFAHVALWFLLVWLARGDRAARV